MGIFCEINLHKPENGAFIGTAGTVVSGVIKYAVDEETIFNNITISLKGVGKLCIERKGTNNEQRKYHKSEIYIDVDDFINNGKEITVPVGAYEIPFKFEIPRNVPPTLNYRKRSHRYNVKCNITYYVRIKFNRPGFIKFAKRFKKDITIISGIVPRLPVTPVIYGGKKKLSQLFTRNPSIVNITANILNSVLKVGDKVQIVYEVKNDTNLTIKAVETKLVEIYRFFVNKREITNVQEDVPDTDSKTGTIQRGETLEISAEINIPSDRESAEFSELHFKEYYVFLTVHLPIPHRNYVLKIPIQIGNSNIVEATHSGFENESPPSYWEAMNEYKSESNNSDEK